jgi:hypothetical protein
LVIEGVTMDLSNPVLKLCQEGMQAEAEGRLLDARALFEQAWAARTDDYDACVAAHYLARRQDDPAEVLRWNCQSPGTVETLILWFFDLDGCVQVAAQPLPSGC